MKKILAWHFSKADRKLNYGDSREIIEGTTHRIDWPWTDRNGMVWAGPSACNAGLHGSKKIIDALQYAPGPVVWRVELSGQMDISDDKIAASDRRYLWGYDTNDVLRTFARRCALDVIHLWDAPDVVTRYLKTGDESLRDAAWAAARAAVRDAAWAAAWAAARAAAWDAAWAAAWAAAWDAAWDAAWAAARDAARAKQNNRLTQMIVQSR